MHSVIEHKIQIKDVPGIQFIQAGYGAPHSCKGNIGDVERTLALLILRKCLVSTGQADWFTIESTIIELQEKDCLTATANFQGVFSLPERSYRKGLSSLAKRTGHLGGKVILNMYADSFHNPGQLHLPYAVLSTRQASVLL